MKKLTLLLLSLSFSFLMLAGTYSGGSGTSADPYQIATTDNLIELSNTSADWGAYFIQTADITFDADETQVDWDGDGNLEHGIDGDDTYGFLPIGSSTDFTGVYDGGGYTIDNLYINRPSQGYIALFGSTDGATITNIGMTNVDITGMNNVGGIVGWHNGGTVSYSYTTGSVHGENDGYTFMGLYVGGIMGTNNGGTISNSYSTASVSGYGSIGGLIGVNSYGTMTKCYAAGSVSGTGDTGGLVGGSSGSDVYDSFWDEINTGQTTSSGGGTPKSETVMKDVATFTDVSTAGLNSAWDFVGNLNDDSGNNDNWDIGGTTNNGYPFLTAPYQPYSGGTGSSDYPYLISSVSDLIYLSHYSDHWDKHFTQTADISFYSDPTLEDWDGDGSADGIGTSGFSPIGNNDTKFAGNYDGQNYTIVNLYINRSLEDYIGLFGRTSSNIISNLGLVNVDITGDYDVGALIGDDQSSSVSSVSNCYSTGQIKGNQNVGGLIGDGSSSFSASSFSDCYSSCTVTGTGTSSNIGGLIGNNSASIVNCYSTGNVNGGDNSGGLIGNNNASIDNCYSTGNIDGDDNVGGLLGYHTSATVSQSYSTGTVTGNIDVGGFVGDNASATVSNSYSTGSITRNSGSSDTDFGGFCGELSGSTIEYCYSTGSVFESDGVAWGTDGSLSDDKGFVGGGSSNTYSSNFFDSEAFNQSTSTGATALTTTQMQDYNTFTDESNTWLTSAWDFIGTVNDDLATVDIWDMDQDGTINNGYPILSWQDGADGVLPVTLLSFTGERKTESRVELSWSTASELNNDRFEIQRSQNGHNFVTIGEVNGAGNSNQVLRYEFTDVEAPEGTIYYRLKQVDYDGAYEYSDIVAIRDKDKKQEGSLSIYPNPVSGAFNLQLPDYKGTMQVEVYNMTGQRVYRKEISERQSLIIQSSAWPEGVYMTICRTPYNVLKKRIIKQ